MALDMDTPTPSGGTDPNLSLGGTDVFLSTRCWMGAEDPGIGDCPLSRADALDIMGDWIPV